MPELSGWFRLHCGDTQKPGMLQFRTGAINYKINGVQRKDEQWTIHPVRRMYGLSFGGKWFFGSITFESAQRTSRKADA